jgi:hypothetical protein
LQQVPSTQKPLEHWLVAAQGSPVGRLTWQVLLPSQKNPFWHSPSTLHIDAHEPLMQVWPPGHILVAPVWQVPAAVQVLASVSIEPVQLPGLHCTPAA